MIQAVNFPLSFLNSCIVTFGNVILVLFFCSIEDMLSQYISFGRKVLFAVLLGTMMVPWTAGIIPWFITMSKLGWLNSFQALIILSCANAFGIFWMRQYCQNNVPVSLVEAAQSTDVVSGQFFPCYRTDPETCLCFWVSCSS